MWTLRDAMAGAAPMAALNREVKTGRRLWEGSGAVMSPFLGNHDVERFTTAMRKRLGDDAATAARMRLAWTFVLTQPGAPTIYYGDEIGMAGGPDPDNRHDMRFGESLDETERDMRAHVRRLGKLRACSTALRRGDYATVDAGEDYLIYARRADSGEVAIVLLNRSPTPRTVRLKPPPGGVAPVFGESSGALEPGQDGRVSVKVPAMAGEVLVTEKRCGR